MLMTQSILIIWVDLGALTAMLKVHSINVMAENDYFATLGGKIVNVICLGQLIYTHCGNILQFTDQSFCKIRKNHTQVALSKSDFSPPKNGSMEQAMSVRWSEL